MKRRITKYMLATVAMSGLAASSLFSAPVLASDATYEVTITNLTRGTVFTPALVLSHSKGLSIYSDGSAASDELAQLAEGGNTAPLLASLTATGKVESSANTGLIFPGTSASVTLSMDDAKHISFASMMLPTNDGFIGANGIRGPRKGKTRVVYIAARDAGSEMNDESCLNIPGPHCGGEGYNAANGEGYVHIHAGIHGEGDLSKSAYDWRNPVAKVTIKRMK